MRVITGTTGAVGRRLILLLVAEGHEVTGLYAEDAKGGTKAWEQNFSKS
jgi:nucleoside-diphosphate-sugar epimerase